MMNRAGASDGLARVVDTDAAVADTRACAAAAAAAAAAAVAAAAVLRHSIDVT